MALSDKQVQVLVTKIQEALNAGQVPWSKQWRSGGMENMPKNGYTGKNYNGYNTMVLLMNSFTDPRYFTYKQVTDMGAFVRKGSKSSLVVSHFPVYVSDKQGKPILNKNGGKDISHFMPRFFNVFNSEQICKEDGTP